MNSMLWVDHAPSGRSVPIVLSIVEVWHIIELLIQREIIELLANSELTIDLFL